MLYDALLILALLFLGTLPFIALRGGESVPAGDLAYRLAMLAIVFLFFVSFWSGYGRTLGMQSWGLRIESAGGGKPDLRQSSLRFLLAILSWLPLGLGYWWQLVDRQGLSWHDRGSGTVIRHYPRSGSREG